MTRNYFDRTAGYAASRKVGRMNRTIQYVLLGVLALVTAVVVGFAIATGGPMCVGQVDHLNPPGSCPR